MESLHLFKRVFEPSQTVDKYVEVVQLYRLMFSFSIYVFLVSPGFIDCTLLKLYLEDDDIYHVPSNCSPIGLLSKVNTQHCTNCSP